MSADPTAFGPDFERLRQRLQAVPVLSLEAETLVIESGSTTGRVLILKDGSVEISKDGVRIAEIDEPGAIFGELAILLHRPHTADVRTTRRSTFHIANAATFLDDPGIALYLATVLAQRLDATNDRLLEIRRKLEREEHPPSAIARMIETLGESLRFGPPI
ncbi:MAG TPA: cyclic nucleotide-binding domain-containing protein [Geminicoccaceae bacterium]